jgi:hypothetical protein
MLKIFLLTAEWDEPHREGAARACLGENHEASCLDTGDDIRGPRAGMA